MIEKDTSRVSMWKTTRMDILVDAFRHQLINILDDFNAWKMSKEEFITKQKEIFNKRRKLIETLTEKKKQ